MRPLAPVATLDAGPPTLRADRSGYGAVLEYAGSRHRAWRTALAWLDRPLRCTDTRGWLVVAGDDDLVLVRDRVQAAVGADAVRAACGAPVAAGDDCSSSFRDAERLLRLRRDAVVGFDDAGLLQALLAVPPERVRWFVQRHLGPILDSPELIRTLRVWLAARGSRRLASERLHLHRNSVGYRVSQLKARLGLDPLDPAHSAVLQAALTAFDLLETEAHSVV